MRIEDRDALLSIIAAVHRAHQLADRVFGPLDTTHPTEARALAARWAAEHHAALDDLELGERQRRDRIIDNLAAIRANLVRLEDHLRRM